MSFKNKVNISVLISLLSVILLLFVIGVYAQDNDTVITNSTDINTTVNNTNNGVREVYVHNYDELKAAVDNLTSHPCERLVINLEDGDYKINTKQIDVKSGQNVVINGNGHTIDCNRKHFMDITSGGTVIINNLTVQNAKLDGYGGAIWNKGGTLTVTSSTFNNNHAKNGGAIANNQGTLTVHDSTFNNNQAIYDNGGAIYNTGTLTVHGSTFNNNQVVNYGCAIYNTGILKVTGSTFNNNQAYCGGAIGNYAGTLTVTGSTFNNNQAKKDGGAINTEKGTLTVTGSTFNNNQAKKMVEQYIFLMVK